MIPAILALFGVLSFFAAWMLSVILMGAQTISLAVLVFGTVLLAAAGIMDFHRFRTALVSRQGRLGMGTAVRVSLFLGIVLLVNAIAQSVSLRVDLTGSSQFTLSPQTREALQELDEPVEAIAVLTRRTPANVSAHALSLLSEYRAHTENLSVREIDPLLSPDQARAHGVTQAEAAAGAVIFVGAGGRKTVYGDQISQEAEQAFTSALLQASGTRQKKVYFTLGHGEADTMAAYGSAASALAENLFSPQRIVLAERDRVPEDAAVLVMVGPRQPLGEHDRALIEDYVNAGGRLLLLLDPDTPETFAQMLSGWWLETGQETIVDPGAYAVPDQTDLLVSASRNAFRLPALHFPGAISLRPRLDFPDDVSIAGLAWTSDAASKTGELPIGLLLSAESGSQSAPGGLRLAVLGDSDFASDSAFADGNNGDLLVSIVRWLAEGTDVVSIRRQALPNRRLLLRPEQARFVNISSMALLPLLICIIGAFAWWSRRAV